MKKLLTLLAVFALSSSGMARDNDTNNQTILRAVLAAQPKKVQARYVYRRPQQTLEFFGIKPSMVVGEALPGGGWYSKILLAFLGGEGKLIGADYAIDMYKLFGFFSANQISKKQHWAQSWAKEAMAWYDDDNANVSAFVFGSLPDQMKGSADAFLFIRAMHNLSRFQYKDNFLATALQNAFDLLKPGGIVGIVQHQAREDMPNDWAAGQNGYLKKSFVIAQMEAAGFEFIAASDINENPADKPTAYDFVWRLPPSYRTSSKDAALRAVMNAIGESNRMTLKFRKPE